MIKSLLIFFFTAFLFNLNYAQDSSQTVGSILVDDAMIFLNDAGAFFTLPLHLSSTGWLYGAGITASTFLLISIDEEVKESVGRKTIQSLNNDIWDISTSYGVTTYASIFSGGVYAAGLISGNNDIRITGRLMLESLTYSGITVILIRYLAGRVRPYYNEGAWKFKGFQTNNEFQSFPSGHTVVAFGFSTILAERIDQLWSRIVFYGLASLTGFSRVYNNQHFLSDVVIGGLIGLGAGLFVINREKERELSKPDEGRFSIFPTFNGIGLRIKLN